jgi:hypothetical protein
MSAQEYRFYSFVNMYLSPMQKGIQTAHAVSEMFSYYEVLSGLPSEELLSYSDWAREDKTVIVLDGGNQNGLFALYDDLVDIIKNHKVNIPVIKFHEDVQSLNGALTAVGILLPKEIYSLNSEIISTLTKDYHPTEQFLASPEGSYSQDRAKFEIAKRIFRYKLAV